jgi:hypothetical protein
MTQELKCMVQFKNADGTEFEFKDYKLVEWGSNKEIKSGDLITAPIKKIEVVKKRTDGITEEKRKLYFDNICKYHGPACVCIHCRMIRLL